MHVHRSRSIPRPTLLYVGAGVLQCLVCVLVTGDGFLPFPQGQEESVSLFPVPVILQGTISESNVNSPGAPSPKIHRLKIRSRCLKKKRSDHLSDDT